MSFLFGNRSNKTFKPKKNIPEGTHQYDLMKHAAATLGSGDLRLAVMLPEGEDLNEWVAVNIVDFFNQINMLYGTITEFCTEESCQIMSAGPKYEYHWADGTTVKKPIKCSAPKYIDYLMTWVQDQLDDENIFPSKIGVPFPKNFISIAKTILKRLFRVYAHIYHQHFHQVVQLDEEAHLNTSFKHFIFFVQEFNLIDKRELAPLSELIEKLIEKRDGSNNSSSHNNNANNSSGSSNSTSSSGPNHHYYPHNIHHQTETNYQYKPPVQVPDKYYPSGAPVMYHQARICTPPQKFQYSQYSSAHSRPLIPSHPPPHYSIHHSNNNAQKLGLPPTMLHQSLPPKPPQTNQYYNVSSNVSSTTPAPPPAYHQHLQQQTYRNLNSSGGIR